VNSFSAIGRIGRDAETRQAGSSTVTIFPLAIDSGFGQSKKSTWWDCSLWGERGTRLVEYLTKGAQIGVQGEASSREYEKNGEKRTALCIRVNDVTLLAKPAKREPERAPQRQAVAKDHFPDDDIPF
jgi:single-strand DNA-binding protein